MRWQVFPDAATLAGQVAVVIFEAARTLRGAETVQYAEIVRRVREFDFVLPGLGEDGHTASLFPANPRGWRESGPEVLAVRVALKPPAERVSLSAARLSRARQVPFLVIGESKGDTVQAWRTGDGR